MDRVTKKDVMIAFKNFCDAYGYRIAKDYKDKGAISVEYTGCYGGYRIYQLLENGGESNIFGSRRRKTSEMADCLWFAIEVMRVKEWERMYKKKAA